MLEYDISVVVGMYNPDWKKLKATLISVLLQKGISYQIVLSDDGSVDNCFEKAKDLFKEYSFDDYKLVGSKMNKGTVIQLIRGVSSADSANIKLLSPGDLFYNEMILSDWTENFCYSKADVTFCDVVCYNFVNKKLNVLKRFRHPNNIQPYCRESSYEDIITNYILLDDPISGASIIAKREVLLYYFNLMKEKVIYTEDFFIRLAVLEKRKINYFAKKGIWYECEDGGISTSKNSRWIEAIKKDDLAMDKICLDEWKNPEPKIYKWIKKNADIKRKNGKWKKLELYMITPRRLLWRMKRIFCNMYTDDVDYNANFILKCFFDNKLKC